jgi:hypothetical protein
MGKQNKILILFTLFLISSVFAQTDSNQKERSNIQNYTPSKLLEKRKIDVKWFNNLYTQTRSESNGLKTDVPRSTFFTSSLEVFTGVSPNKKINAGLILEYRSNSFNGNSATSVFDFKNELGTARNGLSHFAPSIKIAPFNKWNNFSIQSSIFIPLFKDEINANGYLGNKSYIWQNRFYYDYSFSGKKFQLFTELGTRFFFGKKGDGYANNSLELAPGVFLSYFPTQKFTVLTFVQHSQLLDLGNNFQQNYSAVGFGAKYQLTKTLNLETLYSKFVRGNDTGLGQSFNFGLRAIF